MDSDIREVVYIAISAIVLSLVLGFVAVVGVVQRDIAYTRNAEVASNKNMMQHKEYNKYNKKTLVGDEVIECIRMYYDQGITIYVASNSISHKEYNLNNYLIPSNRGYYIAGEGGTLLDWFPSTKTYRAYLVYNSENPKLKFDRMRAGYLGTPESISGSRDAKFNALDRFDGSVVTNSEVTAILIVDAADL